MDLHFLLGFFTCTLRNWNPRPACGTAFSSVHNISSVCVAVLMFQSCVILCEEFTRMGFDN